MLYSDSHPWIPGAVRGFLLALISAAIVFITDWQTTDDLPGWVYPGAMFAVYFLRQGEAFVLDQFRSEKERMSPDV